MTTSTECYMGEPGVVFCGCDKCDKGRRKQAENALRVEGAAAERERILEALRDYSAMKASEMRAVPIESDQFIGAMDDADNADWASNFIQNLPAGVQTDSPEGQGE